jgi:hypothetical protein
MTTYKTQATPKPGTVIDALLRTCPRAKRESYPLSAVCKNCGRTIRCADGSAAWCHTSDYRAMCSVLRKRDENNG